MRYDEIIVPVLIEFLDLSFLVILLLLI